MGKKRLPAFAWIVGASIVFAGQVPAAFAADSIQIQFGSYGYGATRETVTDDLKKACDGKPACNFPVKNGSFAGGKDPSPGDDKGLIVGWKCGSADHKEEFAEGRVAKINCQ